MFAYRNGIVADALRASGDVHAYVLGCQLTDLVAIARQHEPGKELARALWADTKHRECRMIAPMLMPAGEMSQAEALEWATAVENEEIADVLCHRLLRQLPFASELVGSLLAGSGALERYTGYRLQLNLLVIGRPLVTGVAAQVERDLPAATGSLRQVLLGIQEEINEDNQL